MVFVTNNSLAQYHLAEPDRCHTQRPVRDGPVLVKHHVRHFMGILVQLGPNPSAGQLKDLFDAGPDDGALRHHPHRHGLPVD